VRGTFVWLKTHPNFPEVLNPVFNYFFAVYIGDEEEDAMYPINLWNMRENLINDLPRTNNAIEGWHNIFRSTFGPLNKTPRNFVKKLLQEEEAIYQKLLRIRSGEKLKRKRKYVLLGEKLKDFIIRCEERNLVPTQYITEMTNFVFY
jgi:hypothetical protein